MRATRSDSLKHLPCEHLGCNKTRIAKGFCHKHWKERYVAAMTPEQKASFVRACNGIPEPTRPRPAKCECCGSTERARLVVDHDHLTDDFRGWLCDACNSAIGQLGDTLHGVLQAAAYLQRYLENRK